MSRRRKKPNTGIEQALSDMRRRNHNMAERRRHEGFEQLIADYPTRFQLQCFDDLVEEIARQGLAEGCRRRKTDR